MVLFITIVQHLKEHLACSIFPNIVSEYIGYGEKEENPDQRSCLAHKRNLKNTKI